jgi:hypothetical protein
MSDELKAMLEGLTTDELREVQTVVGDLISIAEEQSPTEAEVPFEAEDDRPYESDDRPF